jgi:hypothetical protein
VLLGKHVQGRQVIWFGMLLTAINGILRLFVHPARFMGEDRADALSGFLVGAAVATMLVGLVKLRREGRTF